MFLNCVQTDVILTMAAHVVSKVVSTVVVLFSLFCFCFFVFRAVSQAVSVVSR